MSPRRKVKTLKECSLVGLRAFIKETVATVSRAVVCLEEESKVTDRLDDPTCSSSSPVGSDWRKTVLAEFIEEFGELVMGSVPANLVNSAIQEVVQLNLRFPRSE